MTLSPSHRWAAILLAALAPIIAHAQSKLPADLDPQSRARLPYLKKSDMDAKGQKIFDTLPGAGKDEILRGPLAFSAYNPAVAQALHETLGLKAGIDTKSIDVIRYNRPLAGLNEKDSTVIGFGRQLFHDKKVDSATFGKAVELWGKRGTMDMVAVMSTYAVSGYFAIAVDERSPEGKPELPAVE